MNDPATIEVDFDEIVEWLHQHKAARGWSWQALSRDSGIPHGTLSTLSSPSFAGNREKISARIYAYRQKVESQTARATFALARPDYVETETALKLQFLAEWAMGGRITAAALGPGTGKSMTAEHVKASIGETVYLATMEPTTGSVTAMIAEVMRAMGLTNTSGWGQQRSAQIQSHVKGRKALLIVDEANHLSWDAFEMLRALHDKADLGIFLLGNKEMVERIRGGARSHAYARLNSRISQWLVRDLPLRADVEAFLDALARKERALDEPQIREPLISVALAPGHGGLRELYQTLELAHTLAIAAEKPLELAHVRMAIGARMTGVGAA